MRQWLWVGLALAVALTAATASGVRAALAGGTSTATPSAKCTRIAGVKVGGPISLTGSSAAVAGIPEARGELQAVRDMETSHLLPRGAIKLILSDTKSNPDASPPAFTDLIRGNRVSAIVGISDSPGALRIGGLVEDAGIPTIVGIATASQLSEQGPHWYMVPLVKDYLFQKTVPQIVQILKLKGKTIGELYQSDNDGVVSYHQYLTAAFQAAGVKVVSESSLSTDNDYSAQLTKLRGENIAAFIPDGLVASIPQMAIQARQLGISVPMIGTPAMSGSSILQQAGQALEGAIAPAAWYVGAPDPASKTFVANYTKRFGGQPSLFAAEGYAAMQIFGAALQRACSGDHNKIEAALQAVTKAGVNTIFGRITFDSTRHAIYGGYLVRVVKGQYVAAK